MPAQVTIADAQILKATGKSWQQWSHILQQASGDAALFLRQNYALDFWWSQAIATAFRPPVKLVLRHSSHSSLVKLFKACNPGFLAPVPKADRKQLPQLRPREKLDD